MLDHGHDLKFAMRCTQKLKKKDLSVYRDSIMNN